MGLSKARSGKHFPTPRFCTFKISIIQISCGYSHTSLLTSTHHIYTMGSNKHGALGQGNSVSSCYSPTLVSSLLEFKTIKISSGGDHTLALLGKIQHNLFNSCIKTIDSGKLYAWGLNDQGQLGLGSKETEYFPKEIEFFRSSFSPKPITISEISAGFNHSCVLSAENRVFSFGANSFGQLGNGSKFKQLVPKETCEFSKKIAKISCGYNFSLFLTQQGSVFSCGDNSFGQLGLGKSYLNAAIPTQIVFPEENEAIERVSVGRFSAAVTKTGKIYVWGMNLLCNSFVPKLINLKKKLRDVAVGGDFAVAVAEEGVFVWGGNEDGELGMGNVKNYMEIEENPYFIKKKIAMISCGEKHVVAIGEKTHDYMSPSVLNGSLLNFASIEEQFSSIDFDFVFDEEKGKDKENISSGLKEKKQRKELREIFINGEINNRENCKKDSKNIEEINALLQKTNENLTNSLKTYCEQSQCDLKQINLNLDLAKKSEISEKIPEENDDKIKYLMKKLIEKDTHIADLQFELSKKEALEQALLYKISFLEKALAMKETKEGPQQTLFQKKHQINLV